MPVVASGLLSAQDYRPLVLWLRQHYRRAQPGDGPRILSLSLPIAALDPLTAVAHLATPDRPYAFFETDPHTAVVALGAALQDDYNQRRRCDHGQRLLQGWGQSIQTYAPPALVTALGGTAPAPRFFAMFTFFATQLELELPFPALRLVLPEWQLTWQGDCCYLTANLVLTPALALEDILLRLEAQLQRIQRAAAQPVAPPWGTCPPTYRPAQAAGSYFQRSVARAVTAIRQQRQRKIVLAHVLDLQAAQPFRIPATLGRLRQRYPHCTRFAIGNGVGKTFLGASPERLLTIHNGQFSTDALAGSAPRSPHPTTDQTLGSALLANPKERQEHQFVVDFLLRQLRSLGLSPHCAPSPVLRQLSTIQHLHTPITAPMVDQLHPLAVVAALHPTPAVAGVPTLAACEQIQRYERFDRSLYAAPLGWVDTAGNSEFLVGIRSALVAGSWARLYAGAGIVADSDPVREWAELKLKFRALRQALV